MIEGELGTLRAAVEEAVAVADAPAVAVARGNLVVALASFGSPEFDLEARFHLARVEMTPDDDSVLVAIAGSLVRGDVDGASDRLASAVANPAVDAAQLLKLTFSAVIRAGAACPELPWLKALLARIVAPAERGAAATELIAFLPQGGVPRADAASVAAECVSALWIESPPVAQALLDMTCRALVDANDQPLLAATAGALLQSLPPERSEVRNTVGFLLFTSLHNVGDIDASVRAMHSLLDSLVTEAWDRSNFDLLTSIASVAAEAATTALRSCRPRDPGRSARRPGIRRDRADRPNGRRGDRVRAP